MSIKDGCGDSDCGVSTGIHEGLTFGKGILSFDGFWQYPCRVCAKTYDEQNPNSEYGPAWPYEDTMVDPNGSDFTEVAEMLALYGEDGEE